LEWPSDSDDLKELAAQMVGKPITVDWGPVIGKIISADVVDNA